MSDTQLSFTDSLNEAREWKAANPTAYEQIVAWAQVDMANGCRPTIDLYANLLRRPHFARMLGLRHSDVIYRLNNNLRSQLARLVMEEHPRLTFELRRSKSDAQFVNATPEWPR